MSATDSAETVSGAVVRHVLVGRQLPGGLEPLVEDLRWQRSAVQAGVGSVEQISEHLRRLNSEECHVVELMTRAISPTALGSELATDFSYADSLRLWVSGGMGQEKVPLLIQLQGVLICVGDRRLGISGLSDRVASVTVAALEYFWLNAEIQRLEGLTESRWSELEEDTPAAFELSESMLGRRELLQERFRRTIGSRASLARLAPLIECPVIYPPTLASQAGERLREKSRLGDRLEHLREQLEVFERVYELCGQRISDFISSRRSYLLEWVIVVLLSAEVLLMVIELLGTLSDAR